MVQAIRPEKRTFARRYEESAVIDASAADIFAVVDDHAALSAHMSQSSWMMGGGRMETTVDEGHGQKVGSHIRMSGNAFGIPLSLDEVITEYEPPYRKVWETVGDVKLVVIGHYRWSNIIESEDDRSLLRVSLEYDLPSRNVWLGRLLGRMYAKWCVHQMIESVRDAFER
ncbi:SRPBCC family protein [Halobacterium wangiae]|uniref:SRPBCC family protein n=1 Tax=Halobacterium wangiae TaxID=2902623 RepID=UPI001E5F6818|nr:SRPBCC family protein [Halobacterium wangiae]